MSGSAMGAPVGGSIAASGPDGRLERYADGPAPRRPDQPNLTTDLPRACGQAAKTPGASSSVYVLWMGTLRSPLAASSATVGRAVGSAFARIAVRSRPSKLSGPTPAVEAIRPPGTS